MVVQLVGKKTEIIETAEEDKVKDSMMTEKKMEIREQKGNYLRSHSFL